MTTSVIGAFIEALVDGRVRVVDLTHPLTEGTPVVELPSHWEPIPPLRLRELSAYDERGPFTYKNAIDVGEHVGTHFDAPIHWITGREGDDVSQIPASRLVGPAVVIDKRAEAEADPDVLLSVEDIHAFEREHGAIPRGGWLLLRTGWGARAHDKDAFLNKDANGSHWPGPDTECARWIAESELLGFGTETIGTDAGVAHGFDPPFPVHHFLLGSGKYGLASLANLALLPPTGALVVAAPLRIQGGSGSPMRALAFVPQ
jgi:kynurenine formamidase